MKDKLNSDFISLTPIPYPKLYVYLCRYKYKYVYITFETAPRTNRSVGRSVGSTVDECLLPTADWLYCNAAVPHLVWEHIQYYITLFSTWLRKKECRKLLNGTITAATTNAKSPVQLPTSFVSDKCFNLIHSKEIICQMKWNEMKKKKQIYNESMKWKFCWNFIRSIAGTIIFGWLLQQIRARIRKVQLRP